MTLFIFRREGEAEVTMHVEDWAGALDRFCRAFCLPPTRADDARFAKALP